MLTDSDKVKDAWAAELQQHVHLRGSDGARGDWDTTRTFIRGFEADAHREAKFRDLTVLAPGGRPTSQCPRAQIQHCQMKLEDLVKVGDDPTIERPYQAYMRRDDIDRIKERERAEARALAPPRPGFLRQWSRRAGGGRGAALTPSLPPSVESLHQAPQLLGAPQAPMLLTASTATTTASAAVVPHSNAGPHAGSTAPNAVPDGSGQARGYPDQRRAHGRASQLTNSRNIHPTSREASTQSPTIRHNPYASYSPYPRAGPAGPAPPGA